MKTEYWLLLGITSALIGAVTALALTSRPQSRRFRAGQRLFLCLALLTAGRAMGGVGVNALTASVTLALGFPGYAALTVLSLFP